MKTYILAPNFQYKPSGPIQIGNIIADPFRPSKPLSTPAEADKPVIESVLEYSHEITKEEGRSVGVSFWTNFLTHIGTGVDVTRGSDSLQQYSISELETQYLRDEPLDDDADISRRLKEPRVQSAINAGLFGKRPVYMVTGLKIARGFSLRTKLSKIIGGGIEAEAPIVTFVSTGVRVTNERRDGIANSFTASSEAIVFAYQLHKIQPRSRKQTTVVDIFQSESAFLHDDDEEGTDAESEEISIEMATDATLIDDEDEAVLIKKTELVDEGTGVTYNCLTIKSHQSN